MLKTFGVLLVWLCITCSTPSASAAAPDCPPQRDAIGRLVGVGCGGSTERSSPGRSTAQQVARVDEEASPPPPPEDVGYRVRYGRTPEGEQCVELVDLVGPNEANSAATAQAEARYLRALATTPQCRDAPPAAAVATTPAIEAARFWQQMDLPPLAPHIAPGRAIVGLPAFLETGGAPSVTDGGDTPFGPLTITATRSVEVAWDDGPGSTTGPHDGAGGPYPDGDITWVYGRSGPRDVAVTQTWTAAWAIGEATGTFSGRGTTSTLFGFPVDEVQAVRNR